MTLGNLANVHLTIDDDEQALRYFQKSADGYGVLALRPQGENYVSRLAQVHQAIGSIHWEAKRYDQALLAYRECLKAHERRAALEPRDASIKSGVAAAWHNTGISLRELNRYDEAEQAFSRAVAEQQAALAAAPRSRSTRRKLNSHLTKLAEVQRVAGRPQRAVETMLERKRLWPGDAGELYLAAAQLAVCVELVGKDKPERTADEEAARERIQDEAVQALNEAIAAGYKDMEKIRTDPNLSGLHGHAGFEKLIQPSTSR